MNNEMMTEKSNVGNQTVGRTSKKIGKKVIATLLTVAMLIGVNTGVFASGVEEENGTAYEYVINGNGEITPRINTQISATITDKSKYDEVIVDTPLFDETVKISVDALSSNVNSVKIELWCNAFTTFWSLSSSTLYNGDTCSFDINGGTKYRVRVWVISGNVSDSKPGTVTITVSDK